LAMAIIVAALSMLAFIFRRWYVFDVVGFALAALCFLAFSLPRATRALSELLYDLGLAATGALLTAISIGAPVIVQWIRQWEHRQYGERYAAYWYGWKVEFLDFYHGFGLLIPLACIAVALYALTCKGQRALPNN